MEIEAVIEDELDRIQNQLATFQDLVLELDVLMWIKLLEHQREAESVRPLDEGRRKRLVLAIKELKKGRGREKWSSWFLSCRWYLCEQCGALYRWWSLPRQCTSRKNFKGLWTTVFQDACGSESFVALNSENRPVYARRLFAADVERLVACECEEELRFQIVVNRLHGWDSSSMIQLDCDEKMQTPLTLASVASLIEREGLNQIRKLALECPQAVAKFLGVRTRIAPQGGNIAEKCGDYLQFRGAIIRLHDAIFTNLRSRCPRPTELLANRGIGTYGLVDEDLLPPLMEFPPPVAIPQDMTTLPLPNDEPPRGDGRRGLQSAPTLPAGQKNAGDQRREERITSSLGGQEPLAVIPKVTAGRMFKKGLGIRYPTQRIRNEIDKGKLIEADGGVTIESVLSRLDELMEARSNRTAGSIRDRGRCACGKEATLRQKTICRSCFAKELGCPENEASNTPEGGHEVVRRAPLLSE